MIAPRPLIELATTPGGNARRILGSGVKTDKGTIHGVLTAVLYLSPSLESGYNTCPFATAGCAAGCLGHSSGHLSFTQSKMVRIDKTHWLKQHKMSFLAQLADEIDRLQAKANRANMAPAVRLNGSSDVLWERLIDMTGRHREITFYDYTKFPLERRPDLPSNYSLTYSVSENPASMDRALAYLDGGHNAAIVFRSADMVERATIDGFNGYPVINGDLTDLRFRDPSGHWVGLYAKGAARKDVSGFVHELGS